MAQAGEELGTVCASRQMYVEAAENGDINKSKRYWRHLRRKTLVRLFAISKYKITGEGEVMSVISGANAGVPSSQ